LVRSLSWQTGARRRQKCSGETGWTRRWKPRCHDLVGGVCVPYYGGFVLRVFSLHSYLRAGRPLKLCSRASDRPPKLISTKLRTNADCTNGFHPPLDLGVKCNRRGSVKNEDDCIYRASAYETDLIYFRAIMCVSPNGGGSEEFSERSLLLSLGVVCPPFLSPERLRGAQPGAASRTPSPVIVDGVSRPHAAFCNFAERAGFPKARRSPQPCMTARSFRGPINPDMHTCAGPAPTK
jgi:hypothetical protein